MAKRFMDAAAQKRIYDIMAGQIDAALPSYCGMSSLKTSKALFWLDCLLVLVERGYDVGSCGFWLTLDNTSDPECDLAVDFAQPVRPFGPALGYYFRFSAPERYTQRSAQRTSRALELLALCLDISVRDNGQRCVHYRHQDAYFPDWTPAAVGQVCVELNLPAWAAKALTSNDDMRSRLKLDTAMVDDAGARAKMYAAVEAAVDAAVAYLEQADAPAPADPEPAAKRPADGDEPPAKRPCPDVAPPEADAPDAVKTEAADQ